jgi:hypothetical protein
MRGPTGVRFQRSTEALSRRVGTDVLVTTPTDDQVHELSGGATTVWEELRAPRTMIDLVDRLASAHGEEPKEIAAQIEGCLNSLVRLGVVQEVQDFDG